MRLKKKFFIPSLADMLFLSIFLYLSISKGAELLGDCDTGYHIRAGEWILENFSIPRHDIFSFHTPPIPWTAHEWLSEVIMALIHQVSGLTGVVVFFTFLLALTFYLLFLRIRDTGGNILIAVFVVLLATAASQVHWLARPHVFSLLLLFLWYWILEEYSNGTRNRLYLLPPMMLLWVNLHGGYLSGFMLLGIYLAGELPAILSQNAERKAEALQRTKHLLVTAAICVPVACINPYGYHILLFPFTLVSNKLIMDNIAEFMSPNFHEPSPFKYLLLLLIVVLAASRKRLAFKDLLLVLVFLNMSLYSVRYITLFAIIAAPILVRQTDILLHDSQGRFLDIVKKRARSIAEIDGSAGGILWPVLAVLAIAAAVSLGAIHYQFDPKTKPVAAVRFLEKANLTGNVFNNDEFGDYLIYACWPRYKVFFDGRSDMYGTDRLKEYLRIRSFKKGWETTLNKYKINWIFFDTDSGLVRFLKERKDWVLIYEDKVASIFIRNTGENKMIIEHYSGNSMKLIPVSESGAK
ncbi:MAG: hypothetical protein AB9919_04920 [Geobacteraceae bacterium]